MAADMTLPALREHLRSPSSVIKSPFTLLQQVSRLVNNEAKQAAAMEMVLRALEQRSHFGPLAGIVDALAREVGLFPYVDPNKLHIRDRLAYEFHVPENMGDGFVFSP